MVAIERLLDAYRFPGFSPTARVLPVEGEMDAVVVSLRRRRKKRFAMPAANPVRASTINGLAKFAICPVAIDESSWRLPSVAWSAGGAAA